VSAALLLIRVCNRFTCIFVDRSSSTSFIAKRQVFTHGRSTFFCRLPRFVPAVSSTMRRAKRHTEGNKRNSENKINSKPVYKQEEAEEEVHRPPARRQRACARACVALRALCWIESKGLAGEAPRHQAPGEAVYRQVLRLGQARVRERGDRVARGGAVVCVCGLGRGLRRRRGLRPQRGSSAGAGRRLWRGGFLGQVQLRLRLLGQRGVGRPTPCGPGRGLGGPLWGPGMGLRLEQPVDVVARSLQRLEGCLELLGQRDGCPRGHHLGFGWRGANGIAAAAAALAAVAAGSDHEALDGGDHGAHLGLHVLEERPRRLSQRRAGWLALLLLLQPPPLLLGLGQWRVPDNKLWPQRQLLLWLFLRRLLW
jgi:hypothetical protein